MLEAARQEKAAGRDVVAGYIEPHDRPDTMELLAGMELLTPMAVTYKGIILKEFDLDAALMRRPDLILVDELAHTNAQGCRHKKRYQDVIELLDAGINVYTTVNVQHLESLNDLVCSITGIAVNERRAFMTSWHPLPMCGYMNESRTIFLMMPDRWSWWTLRRRN